MNESLTKTVSDAEIKRVVKAIKSDSSLGADGMTGHFFQTFWEVTRPQIIAEVKRFFRGGSYTTRLELHSALLTTKETEPLSHDGFTADQFVCSLV